MATHDSTISRLRGSALLNPQRPSAQTTAVLLALAETPTTWRYGYELCQLTSLKAGSMYPILMRLADRGLLETTWENHAPAGRPPRHLYRLTGLGIEVVANLTEMSAHITQAQLNRLSCAWVALFPPRRSQLSVVLVGVLGVVAAVATGLAMRWQRDAQDLTTHLMTPAKCSKTSLTFTPAKIQTTEKR